MSITCNYTVLNMAVHVKSVKSSKLNNLMDRNYSNKPQGGMEFTKFQALWRGGEGAY